MIASPTRKKKTKHDSPPSLEGGVKVYLNLKFKTMQKIIDKILFHRLFYFIFGLLIVVGLIGHDYFKEVPSLYMLASYFIGYGARRNSERDKQKTTQ